MSNSQYPTPLEIKALAEDYGYVERRSEASNTLFFKENKVKKINNNNNSSSSSNNNNDSQPILINIFYTTRGIMTQLPHPTQGYNQLWRSSAYDSLESLALLFENPRTHTGKGYRQAKNAVRGCAKCGWQKARAEYSSNQWKAGPGKAICSDCISGGKGGGGGEGADGQKNDGVDDISRAMGKVKLEDDSNGGSFPKLTLESLEQHDKKNAAIQLGEPIQATNNGMERRQFNCPLCPVEGRGKNVFFKKVPVSKPIVKCNKCKAVKHGNCERLYPIPRGDEKGYGHYRCGRCKNTWGSSRAIAGIGQVCQACSLAGNPSQFIKPFRIEVHKSGKSGGITGGGPRPAGRRMRRVPRETISEHEPERAGYSNNDAQRFNNRGGNALAGSGRGGAGRSYDYVEENSGGNNSTIASKLLKSAYKHKCEGCSTGVCRSRKLPISGIHDVHDGNTVSTSASLLTNSEIDKSEFRDMDIDFEDWEEDDDGEQWVTVGPNGKVLKG